MLYDGEIVAIDLMTSPSKLYNLILDSVSGPYYEINGEFFEPTENEA